jgi:hypothetical protein
MPTFDEILNRVRDKSNEAARKGYQIWFRGQSKAAWPVESSIHCLVERYSTLSGLRLDQKLLRDEEKSLYYLFAAEAWPLLKFGQRDPWALFL